MILVDIIDNYFDAASTIKHPIYKKVTNALVRKYTRKIEMNELQLGLLRLLVNLLLAIF